MTLIEPHLLHAESKTLRHFGYLIGGILMVLGGWFLFRHKSFAMPVLAVGAVLALLGALWPRSLKYVYIAWMTLGNMMGAIVSTALLALIYFFALTPIGLVARILRKDFLLQKWPASESSYWMSKPRRCKNRADYERQF